MSVLSNYRAAGHGTVAPRGRRATGSAAPARQVGAVPAPRRPRLTVRMDAAAPARPEVRICTGKVCKKQGSEQIVRFGQDLGLPGLQITAGGCLGNCGNGPNLVVLPEGVTLRHVGTPADLAQALRAFCSADISDEVMRATELRLSGNALAMAGDLPGAVDRYQQALAACPGAGSAYMVHSNLSASYLQLGRKQEALESARKAVAGAPRGFHKAHIRLIDACYALGQMADAEAALAAAVAADSGFKGLPEYKIILNALAGAKKGARV